MGGSCERLTTICPLFNHVPLCCQPRFISPDAYVKILSNPTPPIFQRAVKTGQLATWPKIGIVKNHCQIEIALEQIVGRLRGLERWSNT